MKLEALRVRDPDLLRQVYAFRYRVYVEQEAMTQDADHHARQLTDELDAYSLCYAVLRNGEVAASLRVTCLADLPQPGKLIDKFQLLPVLDVFRMAEICATSRFIIDPALQNGKLVYRLLQLAYIDGVSRGIRLNYGDCSPHLLTFYERLGYRRYCEGYNDSSYGHKIPIVMLIGDHRFLNAVGSPLTRLAMQQPDDVTAREWFGRDYERYAHPESAEFLNEGTFLELLAERIADDPGHRLALLRGLDSQEQDRFLSRATLLELAPGAMIIRRGDRDNTLYVMLSGTAEVRAAVPGRPALRVLGAGDTFGEIGFVASIPRTANVVALTQAQVVVLSGDFTERLIKDEPALGAKVLLNLARVLAVRLALSPAG